MEYKVIWEQSSELTYELEIDYILFKWNYKEVQKFQNLVLESLDRLSLNPFIGKYNSNLKLHSITISKQTTLYYRINKRSKIIELYLFWNNQKNPQELNKLL